MENAFTIMKQTFKEFLKKIKWHIIIIIYDVFNVYYFLHNLIHGRKKMDVEKLMRIIQFKAMYKKMLKANGLQQFEDSVCIIGKELSREQHCHNLKVCLVIQHY